MCVLSADEAFNFNNFAISCYNADLSFFNLLLSKFTKISQILIL